MTMKTNRRDLLKGAGSLVLAFEIPGATEAFAQQAAPAAPAPAAAGGDTPVVKKMIVKKKVSAT